MILENRYGLQHLIENTWPELGEKIDIFTHDPSLKVVKINKPLW